MLGVPGGLSPSPTLQCSTHPTPAGDIAQGTQADWGFAGWPGFPVLQGRKLRPTVCHPHEGQGAAWVSGSQPGTRCFLAPSRVRQWGLRAALPSPHVLDRRVIHRNRDFSRVRELVLT